MAEKRTFVTITGNCVVPTATKQAKGTIPGKTAIVTTVTEPEFTSGSID
jgi:hypothetical protein